MERPILFSGPMVKAILEGRKTQTRRVIVPQPENYCPVDGWIRWRGLNWPPKEMIEKHPKGQPGDSLWVRETWGGVFQSEYGHILQWGNVSKEYRVQEKCCGIFYRADEGYKDDLDYNGVWVPSIFMPRWASRLTLQIRNVRVERVQDIFIDDIKAEGVFPGMQAAYENWKAASIRDDNYQYLKEFQWLWNSINVKRGYGWEVNPWVWVIEFEKVE